MFENTSKALIQCLYDVLATECISELKVFFSSPLIVGGITIIWMVMSDFWDVPSLSVVEM